MTTDIKLDYDCITTKDIQLIFYHRGWLLKYFNPLEVKCDETTHGYHVNVLIEKNLTNEQVAVLQLLMGSDINREIYNFLRSFEGQLIEHYNRLYTKKWILLSTTPKSLEEVGKVKYCPQLQERVLYELERSKDLSGTI